MSNRKAGFFVTCLVVATVAIGIGIFWLMANNVIPKSYCPCNGQCCVVK